MGKTRYKTEKVIVNNMECFIVIDTFKDCKYTCKSKTAATKMLNYLKSVNKY